MNSRTLLVEGTDDQHVIWALLKAHHVPKDFEVKKADGVNKLLESVPTRLRAGSDLERLAVVLDADTDIQIRWQQLSGRLVNAGYAELPDAPASEGTIVELHDGKRFGVWIMPKNTIAGTLEDFITSLVPEGDDMLPRVNDFLAGIPEEQRRFPAIHLTKARIHAWLAVQEQPGRPLGQAITARYLDASEEYAGPFLKWINDMFVR